MKRIPEGFHLVIDFEPVENDNPQLEGLVAIAIIYACAPYHKVIIYFDTEELRQKAIGLLGKGYLISVEDENYGNLQGKVVFLDPKQT